MLYREIIAVCSEIHTKHINTLCGQNVELLNVKLAVHTVTTGLYRVNYHPCYFQPLSRPCMQHRMLGRLYEKLVGKDVAGDDVE
jgi:hypothetical protein